MAKYLVMSKSRGGTFMDKATPEQLKKGKDILAKGKQKGIVEVCYSLVSGGSVWIVNVKNHAELALGLRRWGWLDVHDVEIYPILEADHMIDAHLAHRASGIDGVKNHIEKLKKKK